LSEGYAALTIFWVARKGERMNRTDTLLRLKRFKVDEMKRRVASIEAMRADLDRKLADLDENVAAKSSAPVIPILAAGVSVLPALDRNPPRKSARYAEGIEREFASPSST